MSVFSMAGSNPALPTYPLQRSVRLRSSASAYFNRTPTVAGNQKTWTWSGWVKRGALNADQSLFCARQISTSTPYMFFGFNVTTDILAYNSSSGGALYTTQVFRDPSAWYHIVYAIDTTQATAANRIKLYVNGVQVTAFSTATYPALNADTGVNTAIPHWNGALTNGAGTIYGFFDGYLTEVNFIDGQALTPSSFGAYNSYGVWSPAKYTGTYGTNGFYLNFQDNSALTTTANIGIGKDSSGNGNYWTSNNISITAGVTYDSMLDVPTNTSPTNANFPVLNPLIRQDTGYTTTISGANLNASITYSSGANMVTIPVTMSTGSSGKWYFEVTATSTQPSGGSTGIGVSTVESTTVATNLPRNSYIYVGSDGSKTSYTGTAVNAAYGASYTTNDVIGVALDIDAGTLTFYKNNTSQGTAFTGLAAGNYFPIVSSNGTGTRSYALNCGQRPFTYTPPTGFNRLNTYNLPDSIVPVGAQYMAATIWTGTGATPRSLTNTVNGFSMQPDLVWIKNRSNAYSHNIYDAVRGSGSARDLQSDTTNSEATNATNAALYGYLSAFNSNGFTTTNGTDPTSPSIWVNQSSQTFVAWQWRASNASAVTNTAGTITSSVSANQTAGFSIATATTPASGTYTLGHGLGVAPAMIIFKDRINAGNAWGVYHKSVVTTTSQYLVLNTSAALATAAGVWGSALPTSTVWGSTVGVGVGASSSFVAYCFAEVPGYSKISSYTANGSADGPFVYCGFRPRFILVKDASSGSGNWDILDTSRSPYNLATARLMANQSAAEDTGLSVDVLSNGFKVRVASSDWGVTNGNTVVFAAFAENPFKNALAR